MLHCFCLRFLNLFPRFTGQNLVFFLIACMLACFSLTFLYRFHIILVHLWSLAYFFLTVYKYMYIASDTVTYFAYVWYNPNLPVKVNVTHLSVKYIFTGLFCCCCFLNEGRELLCCHIVSQFCNFGWRSLPESWWIRRIRRIFFYVALTSFICMDGISPVWIFFLSA